MKPSPFSKPIGILLSFLFLLYSCKKENSYPELSPQQEEEASVTTAESDAESESIFNDVFDNTIGVSNEVGLEGAGVFGRTSASTSATETSRIAGCYTVGITPLAQGQLFPLRIVVDFGAGCTGKDGRTRSGKIIVEYTGRLMVPGKSATTTFENYMMDSISVQGTHKITNTSSANSRQFTVEVADARLTKPSGNYVQWNSKRVITQMEGLGTPEHFIDDVFSITGQGTGEVKRNGFATAWESEIVEPLQKRFACHWLTKGKMRIIRKNLSVNSQWAGFLSYGNGTCDRKATFTINGVEHQITLH